MGPRGGRTHDKRIKNLLLCQPLLAGLDCNLVQVKHSLTWHYKQYQREQTPTDQQNCAAVEIEARATKLGLWQDADPVPPWEFRRKQ